MKTVAAEVWGPLPHAENHRTLAHTAARVGRDLRELFVGAYGMFAARCRAIDEPGLAVVGIEESTGRPLGVLTLLARVQRYVAGIIGRHDACDLYLHGNADLSLRQLAIVVDPVHDWAPRSTQIRYRLLDLRTKNGFYDETGRPMRGLRCDGPAIVRCGGFALYLLPLGDPHDWPESASDAWSMIPERVYFDELDRSAKGSMPIVAHAEPYRAFADGTGLTPSRTRSSVVMRTHGPRETSNSFPAVGDHAGTLEIMGKHQRGTLTLGHEALQDGVLIGRYARCDGASLLDDNSLSRVHALLLHVDNALLYIDTASRNGSRLRGESGGRLFALESGTELELGSKTRVRWRWGD
ncbi:MAG TPA: FHA domain-containing protein [Kofleriaceae bacterium]